ncbi:MAG: hypothetical protein CM15mP74_32120 [Halieaceae bacterium]|nr:MAG: hypothetical protein CM15mP74_32120 [Halieaceae bacterium]
MGLPLGWLADRKNRVKIVAVGIAVWSIATAASGLARNFTHLFIARMSIGVGEATLSPCAMSIISDSFPPRSASDRSRSTPWRSRWGPVLPHCWGPGADLGQIGRHHHAPRLVNWCRGRPLFIVGLPGLILSVLFFYCVNHRARAGPRRRGQPA